MNTIDTEKTVRSFYQEKRSKAPDIKSFILETQGDFEYTAGQYAFFDFEYNSTKFSKHFSISNSPTRPHIEFTTIIRNSDYKKALDSLPAGHEIIVRGPYGKYTFKSKKDSKLCFLIGGIGITPVKSMLEFAVDTNLHLDATLFYSNRDSERIVFKNELEFFSRQMPTFNTIHTLTDISENENWKGLTGYINSDMIRQYRPDYKECTFYISGPPAFNKAMTDVVTNQLNISNDQIVVENFMGY